MSEVARRCLEVELGLVLRSLEVGAAQGTLFLTHFGLVATARALYQLSCKSEHYAVGGTEHWEY